MATWSWLTVVFEAVAVGGKKLVLRTEAVVLASFFFQSAIVFSSLRPKVAISVGFSSLPLFFGTVDTPAIGGVCIRLLVVHLYHIHRSSIFIPTYLLS